ncbi:MAG: cytochrome c oxidase accessory protein CcoG [Saccharospirillaceae bacterium]|nr:cytochrome c oxidase accessory protein CcoG [Pseudomonadales bacterium]NRB78237.1 cytochrome c oxidase accessory protein CcoG [Saccharospirillaceae bacterium]
MSNKIPIKNLTQDSNGEYDLYVSSEKIHIRRIKGLFRNLRFFGGIFLFAVFFGFVWLNYNGAQAIVWDIPKREFSIFWITFGPKDLIYLASALIISAFGLFFITAVAGRVWCGYTCPQSVFTWVFMYIEEKCEGKRNARIKLDNEDHSYNRFIRRTLKHILWLVVGFITALTFVGYFSPIRELFLSLLDGSAHYWEYFWVGFFTLATYGNAGWLREQVCIYMCPYSRFQAVMFDENTLVIAYDEKRGENRGSRKKGADYKKEGLGDCIDCDLCVHVCPTGIDIRDGLQIECIGCAACVDACDSVMDQMGYDRGLVKYTSENAEKGKKFTLIRPRVVFYAAVLIFMTTAMVWSISNRSNVDIEVTRDRGDLYNVEDDKIINSYRFKLTNTTQETQKYTIKVVGNPNVSLDVKTNWELNALTNIKIDVFVSMPLDKVDAFNYELQLEVLQDGKVIESEKTTFITNWNP